MISLRGVSKRFGDFTALAPLDLTVERESTTVLIGPSGCGKSTLLRLMIGLLRPSTGEIAFEGRVLSPENVMEVRHRMGYVIQDGGLFPHLTAEDNVLLLGRHLGRPRPELSRRLRELCELTRFPEAGLGRFPADLSGGQRQRVALLRALLLQPDVLLLDEPLAALDPLVRAALQTDLKEIFGRLRQTVVLVTHDMAEAAHFGGRILLFKEGRLVQEGTVGELRERPAESFVTEFLSAQRSVAF
jgi:osmoprotectant transport system ATP-binding protein